MPYRSHVRCTAQLMSFSWVNFLFDSGAHEELQNRLELIASSLWVGKVVRTVATTSDYYETAEPLPWFVRCDGVRYHALFARCLETGAYFLRALSTRFSMLYSLRLGDTRMHGVCLRS